MMIASGCSELVVFMLHVKRMHRGSSATVPAAESFVVSWTDDVTILADSFTAFWMDDVTVPAAESFVASWMEVSRR